ncbi:hypothetical protein SBOR_7801 [Sclerotinia borealis F-4128]|uniref:Uncharacterized protein n=1 Tax=Sclerotinia borealis (strain F-4128) TaxID=1432307 RepID=W9C7K1_SCLBF|nr:hypothetical protein SBOR_7801 [Sclerotinia borealis F-4128]
MRTIRTPFRIVVLLWLCMIWMGMGMGMVQGADTVADGDKDKYKGGLLVGGNGKEMENGKGNGKGMEKGEREEDMRYEGYEGKDQDEERLPLPSYHFGAGMEVQCLERDFHTGEHIQLDDGSLKYIPFPICNETGKPLELKYGIEEELNCTIPIITDSFFHILEFYIHSDAPLSCRLPSRPAPTIHHINSYPNYKQEYIPLTFALAGTFQLSHLHIASHLNVLLHSVPKHRTQKRDSGVLGCGVGYSTGGRGMGRGMGMKKLIIGDELGLRFSVRWFQGTMLPGGDGRGGWRFGEGGYGDGDGWRGWWGVLGGFAVGVMVMGSWVGGWGRGVSGRGRGKLGLGGAGSGGKSLGGATPLGYGVVGSNGGGGGAKVGNGWGFVGGGSGGGGGRGDGKRD